METLLKAELSLDLDYLASKTPIDLKHNALRDKVIEYKKAVGRGK